MKGMKHGAEGGLDGCKGERGICGRWKLIVQQARNHNDDTRKVGRGKRNL
jgi:hypothetical protein